MKKLKRIIWIDWGYHLRTQTLSNRLGVKLYEVYFDGSRLRRYILSTIKTLKIIRIERPDIIIATNPSIILGFVLFSFRLLHNFHLISDAHYFGVKAPNEGLIFQALLNFYNSRVHLVIVTNEGHRHFLSRIGAQTYICQDPLPELKFSTKITVQVPIKSVFFICSFDRDEPYEEVFLAFDNLKNQGFVLFVSGNYQKSKIDLSQFPWVRFLGFLPENQYYEYLQAVSVVMDLTTSEDCLVCGAYEALSFRKPLIVSRKKALSDYFGDAVVLTDNTSKEICESILLAFENREKLSQRADNWVIQNSHYMSNRITDLNILLQSLDHPS